MPTVMCPSSTEEIGGTSRPLHRIILATLATFACTNPVAPDAATSSTVTISPSQASLIPGATQAFTATVTGTVSTAVTWSVQEGTPGGTITTGGLYTASASSGTFHVVGTVAADPTKSATAVVTIAQQQPFTPQNIGLNLDAVSYFNTSAMFCDMARQICGNDGINCWDGTGLTFDANGYPSNAATNAANANGNQYYPAGTYTVTWSGPTNAVTVTNGVSGWTSTGPNSGRYTRVAGDVGVNGTAVLVTGNSISNLSIQAPASVCTGHFLTKFVNRIHPFSTIRLMDMLRTNVAVVSKWSDRRFPPPSFPTSASSGGSVGERGALYEDMIVLANEQQKDLWFNIPLYATDDYICRLARLMAYGESGDKTDAPCNPSAAGTPNGNHLNSTSTLYLEYGNELWNFGFNARRDLYCMANGYDWDGTLPCNSYTTPNGQTFNTTNGSGSATVKSQLAVGSPIAATLNRNFTCSPIGGTDAKHCGAQNVGSADCLATNWDVVTQGHCRRSGLWTQKGVPGPREAIEALLSKRIYDTFNTVYATAGRLARFKVVLGTQFADVPVGNVAILPAKQLDKSFGGSTHNAVYKAMAVAPYFDHKNTGGGPPACAPGTLTTAACQNFIFQTAACTPIADGFCYDSSWRGSKANLDYTIDLDFTNTACGAGRVSCDVWLGWLNGSIATANALSLPLIAYEGGQSFFAGGGEASPGHNNWDSQLDPRMYTAIRHMFNLWKAKTDGQGGVDNHLFNYFNFTMGWSRFGYWGALQNDLQTGSQKYDALLSLTARRGDINLDGVVDANDCSAMTANWCQTGRFWQDGDLNHDGKVSEADLAILNTYLPSASCARPSPCSP